MKVLFEMQGVPTHEVLVCLKADDYFMTISATAPDEGTLDRILEGLALIK